MHWTNRTDLRTASVIDTAVLLAHSHGVQAATTLLLQHGLTPSTISRILTAQHRPPVSAYALTQAQKNAADPV